MTLKEKREYVLKAFEGKPYIYDGIPLMPTGERDIFPSYNRCPDCMGEMMSVTISSDSEYWHKLCGREGILKVCSQCGNIGEFKLMKMN